MFSRLIDWVSEFFRVVFAIAFVVLLAIVTVSVYLFVVFCDFVYFVWEKIWGGKERDGA